MLGQASRRPDSASRLGRLISSHPVAAFVVMSLSITYSTALISPLTQPSFLPYDWTLWDPIASLFGCAVPAFVVTAACASRPGVRDLANRSLRWRVGLRWYFVAVLALPVATILCASAFSGLAPLEALVDKWSLLFTLVLPQLLLRVILLNLAEEVGFMGFLQATLNDRYGSLKASVLTAVPFAFWHLPTWMLELELGLAELYLGLAVVVLFGFTHVFARIFLMWLYNNSSASVLLVALFHATFNTTVAETGLSGEFLPDGAGFPIATTLLIAAAIGLVVFTKGRLSGPAPQAEVLPILP